MSWSGGIVDDEGEWVEPTGDEAAAWKDARDAFATKNGSPPSGFENGYICLSNTYVTANRMGYSIANMDLDEFDVAAMAEAFEQELPEFLKRYPDDEFYADYLVSFFKTAAQFKRGIRGGH